jgi:hypothetical protein
MEEVPEVIVAEDTIGIRRANQGMVAEHIHGGNVTCGAQEAGRAAVGETQDHTEASGVFPGGHLEAELRARDDSEPRTGVGARKATETGLITDTDGGKELDEKDTRDSTERELLLGPRETLDVVCRHLIGVG